MKAPYIYLFIYVPLKSVTRFPTKETVKVMDSRHQYLKSE